MTQHPENIPAYRTIRMSPPIEPVQALADVTAWQARDRYPDVRFAGGPVFGVARERESGGWELYPHFTGMAPQDARDAMGAHFRRMAQDAEQAGDAAGRAQCLRAAETMDWEPVDDITVAGTRYRVVRAERFLRTGPVGPEPPRPTDPDTGEVGMTYREVDPAGGFVIDPGTVTGLSDGILTMELLGAVFPRGTVPEDVHRDAKHAAATHPGGVLMPASFMTVERVGGRWLPNDSGTSCTPQSARDGLASHLRVMAPWRLRLDDAGRVAYNEAADRLDAEPGNQLSVDGRHFRIVRVERLIRIGPDGPETSRPSDADPTPPVMVQNEQLRAQGLLDENAGATEGDNTEIDEATRRFEKLFLEEQERRAAAREARRTTRGTPGQD
ncbi:DUF5954 family protein [Streptantibioticus silvisoli]|uniref:DUF5954 family protein n=1 Tax=Streptantibioticus silvisoli TaxID=2705255 RepID=A0ABT6VU47_9ACTN|nr:DUF5954 family protein [Streptantibioticus silvisoli]MDI5961995.1 DUF5954 family protein [Streptantibioticus silvisoli]